MNQKAIPFPYRRPNNDEQYRYMLIISSRKTGAELSMPLSKTQINAIKSVLGIEADVDNGKVEYYSDQSVEQFMKSDTNLFKV